MANKKHLRLLSEKQLGEVGKVKFNYGFPTEDENDEPKPEPNYYYMANALRSSVARFETEIITKYQNRNI